MPKDQTVTCKCINSVPGLVGLQEDWKAHVTQNAKLIDPTDDFDWHDMAVGWALGKGLLPMHARHFAQHLCYHTNLA